MSQIFRFSMWNGNFFTMNKPDGIRLWSKFVLGFFFSFFFRIIEASWVYEVLLSTLFGKTAQIFCKIVKINKSLPPNFYES